MASKQEYERAFQAWAQDKPEYRDVLKELKAEYARIFDAYFALELMSETIRTGELNRIYNRPSFGDEIYPQVKALNRDLFRVLYREYYDNCPQEYMVPLFAAEVERLGSPEAYAELMFEATHKEDESTEAPELEALRADIRTTVTRIFDELGKCSTRNLNSERLNELYTTYIKGLREWDTERAFYPDANLTLRVAYGKVGATGMPTEYITSPTPLSKVFWKRTIRKFTTTTSRSGSATSSPPRTTDAGAWRSTAARPFPSASLRTTIPQAATPARRYSTAGAS